MAKTELTLRIPFSVLGTREWIKWSSTKERVLWEFLMRFCIRSRKMRTGNLNLRKYLNDGRLVARWNREQMAKTMGCHPNYVSKLITGLNEKGLIKIHKEIGPNHRFNVYELGQIKDNKESIYVIDYFRQKALEESSEKYQS